MGTTCICHLEYAPKDSPPRSGYLGPLEISKNYHLFAALAGVRNGTWGMRINPLSKPKGLPQSATPEVKEDAAKMAGYTHSHSWHTLRDLLEFDWDQEVPHETVIDLDDPRVKAWFDGGNRSIAPPHRLGLVRAHDGSPADRFRKVAWKQKLRLDVNDFLEGVLPYLKYIVSYCLPGPPENIRIVFWFKD